jgi:ABC-type multidrug transport system fused ATPase/permease subunit
MSAVPTAFFRFLPTVPTYFVFHAIFLPHAWSTKMLLSIYLLATMIVLGMGLAAFFAALQVYYRDTSSFLPFFVRIWMYLCPILWAPEHVIDRFSGPIMSLIQRNPMYSMLGSYPSCCRMMRSRRPICGYCRRSGRSWPRSSDSCNSFRGSVSLLSVLSNGELPPAIRVNDLSITYRTTLEREPTLKQALIRFGRGQRTVKEIEAIKDVTSQVRTGTAMGIIGSNGSVMSTLMRAMAGLQSGSDLGSRSRRGDQEPM